MCACKFACWCMSCLAKKEKDKKKKENIYLDFLCPRHLVTEMKVNRILLTQVYNVCMLRCLLYKYYV